VKKEGEERKAAESLARKHQERQRAREKSKGSNGKYQVNNREGERRGPVESQTCSIFPGWLPVTGKMLPSATEQKAGRADKGDHRSPRRESRRKTKRQSKASVDAGNVGLGAAVLMVLIIQLIMLQQSFNPGTIISRARKGTKDKNDQRL
jgi:hypothetical protein